MDLCALISLKTLKKLFNLKQGFQMLHPFKISYSFEKNWKHRMHVRNELTFSSSAPFRARRK